MKTALGPSAGSVVVSLPSASVIALTIMPW
jgi:hypothetical protein